ncbi:MAG TPA: hypothetical protein VES88_12095 [Gemmatimonadaceae bacterium]|nr:hypothetical protein [Gemmatimonadaceae bacterium]
MGAEAQLVTFPADAPLRIKQSDGRFIYGCGTLKVDQAKKDSVIEFRFRKLGRGEPRDSMGCELTSTPIKLDSSLALELRQLKGAAGIGALKGTAIGATLAGASYWSLGNARPKCEKCFINTTADWVAVGGLLGAAVGAAIGAAYPKTEWVRLRGPALAASRHRGFGHWLLGKVQVEGTAGAGFAGVRVGEVLVSDSTSAGYVPLKNYRYDWRPAVSTGIVGYVYSDQPANLGAGLGFQIVSLPTTSGKTFPFPAITFHLGTPQTEFFVGVVLTSTDSVGIPRDSTGKTIRQGFPANTQQFLFPNTRKSRHLYVGIQIKGTRKGAAELGVPDNAQVEIDVRDTLLVAGNTLRLWAHLTDSLGNVVGTGPPKFEIVSGDAARLVDGKLLIAGDSAGSVVVKASIGGKEKYFTIRVTRPAAAPSPVIGAESEGERPRKANSNSSSADAAERMLRRFHGDRLKEV